MDEIFHDVHGIRGALDVVKVSLTKPRRFGKNGELLISYEETAEYQEVQRRRSSVVSGTGAGMPQLPLDTERKYSEGAQQDEEKASSNENGN